MIGIVILNYNSWQETFNCIKSILNSKQNHNYKVYLIDNNSTDIISEELKKLILSNEHEIYFEISNKNGGYSAGNNIGIHRALEDNCDYVLISNNDIMFSDYVLDDLVSGFSLDENIGIVSPVLIRDNNKPYPIRMKTKTTYSKKIFHLTFLNIFLSKNKKEEYIINPPFVKKYYYVDSSSGAFFMMKRKAALAITPLDENTFLYEEELIIGERMRENKFKTLVLTNTNVKHIGGQSTKSVKAFSYTEFVKSEIYFCSKYLKVKKWKINLLFYFRLISYLKACVKNSSFRKYFKTFLIETKYVRKNIKGNYD